MIWSLRNDSGRADPYGSSRERLCHMEEIKTLRARYVRSVDTQNWEALW